MQLWLLFASWFHHFLLAPLLGWPEENLTTQQPYEALTSLESSLQCASPCHRLGWG